MQELGRFRGGVCSNPENPRSFLGLMNSVRNTVEQSSGPAFNGEGPRPSTFRIAEWRELAESGPAGSGETRRIAAIAVRALSRGR